MCFKFELLIGIGNTIFSLVCNNLNLLGTDCPHVSWLKQPHLIPRLVPRIRSAWNQRSIAENGEGDGSQGPRLSAGTGKVPKGRRGGNGTLSITDELGRGGHMELDTRIVSSI